MGGVPNLHFKTPPSGPNLGSQGTFESIPQWNVKFQLYFSKE